MSGIAMRTVHFTESLTWNNQLVAIFTCIKNMGANFSKISLWGYFFFKPHPQIRTFFSVGRLSLEHLRLYQFRRFSQVPPASNSLQLFITVCCNISQKAGENFIDLDLLKILNRGAELGQSQVVWVPKGEGSAIPSFLPEWSRTVSPDISFLNQPP